MVVEHTRVNNAMAPLIGRVVSTAMKKTVVVRVERMFANPVTNQMKQHRRKFIAHDEQETCKFGDTVRIKECRPISKNKKWIVEEIVKEAS